MLGFRNVFKTTGIGQLRNLQLAILNVNQRYVSDTVRATSRDKSRQHNAGIGHPISVPQGVQDVIHTFTRRVNASRPRLRNDSIIGTTVDYNNVGLFPRRNTLADEYQAGRDD